MAALDKPTPTLSILVMIVVGLVVGVCAAAIFEGLGLGGRAVALISGGLAVLVASILRFKLMSRMFPAYSSESTLIGTLVVYGVISTIAGGLAGHDLYSFLDARMPIVLGAIAGLLSVSVMSIAMVTFHEGRLTSNL
ncbi:hypothetical protein [Methylopila sp. M107]|uniref:hypothetical protein n=1 Tax=Methylopila sp. M107 TaxID=1101190 RepID=UPI00035E16C0|nr:hypothetical protein [Methylopila sp. M107]